MADEELDYDTIIAILDKANAEEKAEAARKKKHDPLVILPVVFSLTAFLMVVTVWIILDRVNPHPVGSDWQWLSFFARYAQPHQTVNHWPKRPVNISYMMLIVSTLLSITAIGVNRYYIAKNGGKYRFSVFLVAAITLLTFVMFLIEFLPKGILGM